MIASDGNSVQCERFYPYPGAVQPEIFNAGTSSSWHSRYCGAWIHGSVEHPETAHYWAFQHDNRPLRTQMFVDVARVAGRTATTSVGKVRRACERTILGGGRAIRAAAVLAYRHLTGTLRINDAPESWTTPTNHSHDALVALGALSGHFCDAHTVVGTGPTWQYAKMFVRDGPSFPVGLLAASLRIVGVPEPWPEQAEAANGILKDRYGKADRVSLQELEAFASGASAGWVPGSIETVRTTVGTLDAFAELARDDPRLAAALLKGLSAYCSLSLGSTFSDRLHTEVDDWIRATNAQRPLAAGLTRLARPPHSEPMQGLTPDSAMDAAVVTLQQLYAAPTGDALRDCARFVEGIFPDQFDEAYFNAVVPPTLYARMEDVANRVRAAVVHALKHDPALRAAILDPDLVAARVIETRLIIAGAPRGSWAAPQRPLLSHSISSSDGVFVMALKQSRALFLNRVGLLRDAAHMCEWPPSHHSLEENAYVSPYYGCVVMLLGMARRPWADLEYSPRALLTGWGYIVAHEFSHMALVAGYAANLSTSLLRHYEPGTEDESIADAIAVLALAQDPTVNVPGGVAEFCARLSQLWCARTPRDYLDRPLGTHPRANMRGDSACETLSAAGYTMQRN